MNELVTVNERPVTLLTMMEAAREQNYSLEQIKELMELQARHDANEARKAYHQAVAEFKREDIVVKKDKTNKHFDSKYTGIGNLVNTVNPILGKWGLNASWDIQQSDKITVTCKLSHAMGHSESVSMSAQPDTSGGSSKNPIQQIKSTVTYLKIATYEAVTGIASMDDPGDDDGNKAGKREPLITEAQAADLGALIDELPEGKRTEAIEALYKWLGIDNFTQIPAKHFKKAVQGVEARRKKA